MSYLVLARKYRPSRFSEVVGQDHITDLLARAVSGGRVAHACLFCGPRGIGKTSCARILAKCLNCEQGPTTEPCGTCASCKEIAAGNSFDVLEIDGASNRGIDEIRALRENIKFAPGTGRSKIYIVDEVHMLTMEAFNALLKTLEEPPEHVHFIFATTDPNRVPQTIISRCQRYDFKRPGVKVMAGVLRDICDQEKFDVDGEALFAIAKAAQGSVRDALGILDQVSAFSERGVKSGDVYAMLGLVETDLLFALSDAISRRNCADGLRLLDEIIERGKDIKQLTRDLVEHFRNLIVIRVGGKSLGRLVDNPVSVKEIYLQQSRRFALKDLLDAVDAFIEAQEIARVTETLRTPLEIAIAKLTYNGEGELPPAPTLPEAGEDPAAKPESKPAAPATSSRPSPAESRPADKVRAESTPPPVELIVEEDEVDVPDGGEVDALAEETEELTIERIRRAWSALTYAVSRQRMSLATFLQEGSPVDVRDGRLMIGFAPEFQFHKESLEHTESIDLLERTFSEKLKSRVKVEFLLLQSPGEKHAHEAGEPMVRKALDAFGGRIVSKWHNE